MSANLDGMSSVPVQPIVQRRDTEEDVPKYSKTEVVVYTIAAVLLGAAIGGGLIGGLWLRSKAAAIILGAVGGFAGGAITYDKMIRTFNRIHKPVQHYSIEGAPRESHDSEDFQVEGENYRRYYVPAEPIRPPANELVL